MAISGWNIRYGRWWAVQWQVNGWVSFGIHLDWRCRYTASGKRYGPYVDLHLGCVILSLGVNPIQTDEWELLISVSRGGKLE